MSDRNIVDYIQLDFKEEEEETHEADELMENEWEPFDPPAFDQGYGYQAIVKYENKIEFDFCERCVHLVGSWEPEKNCKCECHTGE